jgi:hypothetical protein
MIDFPNGPTVGQLFSASGMQWRWDGTKWVSTTTSVITYNDVGRNLLHNPLFNIVQRGTGPFTTNGALTADRWRMSINLDTLSLTIGAMGVAQIPGQEEAQNRVQAQVTGNAGAAAYTYLQQSIERVSRLGGKTVTLSFFAVGSVAGLKVGASIDQYFGSGGSPSPFLSGVGQSVTISSGATGFIRYSMTFALPSVSGKTLGTNGDDFTAFQFWLSSGSNQASRAGNVGVQNGVIYLYGIQLEVGSVTTPLEIPDPQQDLAKCQRFYQTGTLLYSTMSPASGASFWGSWIFATQMRAAPTVNFANITYGGSSTLAVNYTRTGGFGVNTLTTGTGATYVSFDFNASADL